MKSSEFTLRKFPEVYSHYLNKQQPVKLSRAAAMAVKYLIRPRITYAEGAREEIKEIESSGQPLLATPNHRSYWDTLIAMGVVHDMVPERYDRMHIVANSGSFHGYNWNDLLAQSLTYVAGGVPMPRKYEFPDATADELMAVQQNIYEQTNSIYDKNGILVMSGEGKQYKGKSLAPDTIGRIRPALGTFAHLAALQDSPAYIAVYGTCYNTKPRKFNNPWHASVYVDNPIEVTPDMGVDEITDQVQTKLLSAVKLACAEY